MDFMFIDVYIYTGHFTAENPEHVHNTQQFGSSKEQESYNVILSPFHHNQLQNL